MRLRLFLVGLVILLNACAPRVEGIGPATGEAPVLRDNVFIMADGYHLPVMITMPKDEEPKAVLVALHGFNDYSNAFSDSARDWAAAGIAVYAYDQRGFGATAGRGLWYGAAALAGDLAAVTDILRDRHPGLPIAVLGESMGGAVLIAALTDPDLPRATVDRAILSAPAVWGRAVMPWWQRVPLTLFSWTLPWLEVAPRIDRRPSDNIPMLRALSADPLIIRRTRLDAIHGLVGLMDRGYAGLPYLGPNTLLLYGLNEDILPDAAWRGGVRRLTPSAGWRLALYDKGFHMLTRDLNADLVIADISAFVLDPKAPLPSGREADPGDLLAPEN